jgi:hypothetical protein
LKSERSYQNPNAINSVEEEETEDARPRRKAAIAADRFRAELYISFIDDQPRECCEQRNLYV